MLPKSHPNAMRTPIILYSLRPTASKNPEQLGAKCHHRDLIEEKKALEAHLSGKKYYQYKNGDKAKLAN
ncbi:MAG: hypothetical protein GY794_15785 [bacterium]|nr:hypothetical protein [bacterium]